LPLEGPARFIKLRGRRTKKSPNDAAHLLHLKQVAENLGPLGGRRKKGTPGRILILLRKREMVPKQIVGRRLLLVLLQNPERKGTASDQDPVKGPKISQARPPNCSTNVTNANRHWNGGTQEGHVRPLRGTGKKRRGPSLTSRTKLAGRKQKGDRHRHLSPTREGTKKRDHY